MQDADWSTTNLKKAHLSTSKLRAATKLWRSFNPECSVSRGRVTSDELSFEAVHTLGSGVAASWAIRAFKVDDASCSPQVRMGLYDERVNALRSIAMGLDTSLDFDAPTVLSLTEGQADFLDFDVLTVSSMMDGQETPNDPILKSNVDVEQLAHVIGEYSRRIERIWNFAGGPSIQSLERLTVWVLRNSDVVGSGHTLLGGICGAFAYGEKELAHELIAQLMSEWEDLRRLAPTDQVLAVYDHVRGQVERLQEAVKRPN